MEDSRGGCTSAVKQAVPARGGSPLVLVISDQLDTSLEAVKSAGGEVVEGPFDYPGGRRFHFRDPSGNVLGVFEPGGG